jgi:hypothetical protein
LRSLPLNTAASRCDCRGYRDRRRIWLPPKVDGTWNRCHWIPRYRTYGSFLHSLNTDARKATVRRFGRSDRSRIILGDDNYPRRARGYGAQGGSVRAGSGFRPEVSIRREAKLGPAGPLLPSDGAWQAVESSGVPVSASCRRIATGLRSMRDHFRSAAPRIGGAKGTLTFFRTRVLGVHNTPAAEARHESISQPSYWKPNWTRAWPQRHRQAADIAPPPR